MNLKEYNNLVEELNLAIDSYYNKSISIMEDSVFDQKMKSLERWEEENNFRSIESPIRKVGAFNEDNIVEHVPRMYSLQNTYNIEDVKKFLSKFPDNTNIVLEPKYDGVSLSLRYVEGTLVEAVTRGDGRKGELVYRNTPYIENIPYKLKESLDVIIRGEVVFLKENFEVLKDKYSNTRNIASGLLRSKNIEIPKGLYFKPYQVIGLDINRHSECMNYLNKLGFAPLENIIIFKNNEVDNIVEYIDNFKANILNTSEYDIDGIVLKIDNLALQATIGFNEKYPKWATAYKFENAVYETILEDIEWNVSRNGKLTPVAILKPVNINGVTISRASLHNFDIIEQLDLRVGDYVNIIRSAEVIPKIVGVNYNKRINNLPKTEFPITCPCCGEVLVDKLCINKKCPDIVKSKAYYYTSRDVLDIKGISENIINTFYNIGILVEGIDILNIINIHIEELSKSTGISTKILSKIYTNILESFKLGEDRKLLLLEIEGLGKSSCNKFIARYPDFKLEHMLREDFKDVINQCIELRIFGLVVGKNIEEYIQKNKEFIEKIIKIIRR